MLSRHSPHRILQPDTAELILCRDSRFVCDTYMFDPSPGEEDFGYLFAAGEAENRGGVGAELLETTMTAMQREYYRDQGRSTATSFEMALHQANLILHDTAEQGVRDWMGYFHMAVGVLIGQQLHLSVAGGAKVYVARKTHLVDTSSGLAHFPITNPLQTFSQVASGEVAASDILFFTTNNFGRIFRLADVGRFTLEQAAATISQRLEQLYSDQGHREPLAVLTVSLRPPYGAQQADRSAVPATAPVRDRRQTSSLHQANLAPRQPLIIHRSAWQQTFLFIAQILVTAWQSMRRYVWPVLKYGSQQGGRVLIKASRATGRNLQTMASRGKAKTLPYFSRAGAPVQNGTRAGLLAWTKSLPNRIRHGITTLPISSKVFAVIAIVLLLALSTSIFLLQRKRSADRDFQQASELLHEARTKKGAAETALIYDNRDQARGLLQEARDLTARLDQSGLYAEESALLASEITAQYDRLQRITRASSAQVEVVGDVATLISGKEPTRIFLVDDAVYTFNPENNSIVKVTAGSAPVVVHQTSQGIGFLTHGAVHQPDKTITFGTDPAGIALFDAKDETLLSQDIQFSSSKPELVDMAVFGNRLYAYDKAGGNIFSFNKTLRGYSSGSAWITQAEAPTSDIKSIAVDGNIFTLHQDGTIRRFFKGELAEFAQEQTDPGTSSAARLFTVDTMQYLYVLDPPNRRVIVYEKTGQLVRQILVEAAQKLTDISISPDEKTLYALDGTRILKLALE